MKNTLRTLVLPLVLISLEIIAQPFNTQYQWEIYFRKNISDLDPIEGIWSVKINIEVHSSYDFDYDDHPEYETMVIYKVGSKYKTYDLNKRAGGGLTFVNTAANGIYLMVVYPIIRENAILTGNGLLEFAYEVPKEILKGVVRNWDTRRIKDLKVILHNRYTKIFPSKTDYARAQPISATGFAISSDGIIVTSFHVIDGAKTINVRGINSDFNNTYKAKLLMSDKNNDLALIQIDDNDFTSIGTVPYIIKISLADVGENIFVLGYPLRATMGDEIKLTNGIISSRTGFAGDITSYQISAPVQPGNSGAPLFDSEGNLIGIITAKHSEAENASYAVKSSYLTNLIELLPNDPNLQMVNSLSGKSLPSQVEIIKKFVYIIETQ